MHVTNWVAILAISYYSHSYSCTRIENSSKDLDDILIYSVDLKMNWTWPRSFNFVLIYNYLSPNSYHIINQIRLACIITPSYSKDFFVISIIKNSDCSHTQLSFMFFHILTIDSIISYGQYLAMQSPTNVLSENKQHWIMFTILWQSDVDKCSECCTEFIVTTFNNTNMMIWFPVIWPNDLDKKWQIWLEYEDWPNLVSMLSSTCSCSPQ